MNNNNEDAIFNVGRTANILKWLDIDYGDPFKFESYCEGIIHYVKVSPNIEKIHITFYMPENPCDFLDIDSFDLHLGKFVIYEIWKLCDGQAYADREIIYEEQ